MRHLLLLSFFLVSACSSEVANDAGNPPSPGGSTDTNPPSGQTTAPTPPPCSGTAGTFHDQAFDSDGETRHYWLHVPASYDCTKPAAMLVDFHGTGFGGATDTVEESWATPDLVSASDDLGFIVVRPRSRSQEMKGGFVYQWDINAGDVPKNKRFAEGLVADLETRYNVDPKRLYASGFSNGPNMAAQFLADDEPLFHGYGLIAGGLHAPLKRTGPFGADAPRIYTMTGFRDYMLTAKWALERFLAQYKYPESARFDREADTGHEVYGWNFREAFAWMDHGARPAGGTLRAGWTKETTGVEETFVEATEVDGALVVVGANGGVYARSSAGAWTKRTQATIAPLTDVCRTPEGKWFATGAGSVTTSSDGLTWSELPALPEFGTMGFGYTHATTVGCASGRVTVGGAGSTATSIDDGKTWTAGDASQEGYGAYIAAVRRSGEKWLALGYYDFVGTSSDGVAFSPAEIAGTTQWWNDGASDGAEVIVAVGEGGALMRSSDGGATFASVPSPTREDLYAVSLRGARGVAVGAHGAVISTGDGGVTWTDRSTGLDGHFGAVRFLSDTTVVVMGERGTALRADL